MQIDHPRWPPGTVTKNSINTKMTISQDPFVEIDPTLCQNVSCMNPLYFLEVWDSKMATVTKNSTEHENDDIFNNCLMDFDQICVRMILAWSCFKFK